MINIELQEYLKKFPDDMPIKLLVDTNLTDPDKTSIIDLTEENILHTSETAYVNENAPDDQHDHEDGKIELGKGQQYLLFNPIIV